MDNAALTNYSYLMEIIDKYKAAKTGKDVGPMGFLREDVGVRYFTTTPRFRGGVESLKTYLAKDILGCYSPGEAAKYVTYKNIYDNLAGTAKKIYSVNTNLLEKCFDISENIASVKSTSFMFPQEMEEGLKYAFQYDEHMSWFLIHMIQKNVEKHMYAYWKLCTSEAECDEKKENEYRKIAYGAALHEIFFKEMLANKVFEMNDEIENDIQMIWDNLSVFDQNLKKQKSAEAENNISDVLLAVSENLLKKSIQVVCFFVCSLLTIEQQIYCNDELTLLMIFDSVRYGSKNGCTFEKAIRKIEDANIPNVEGINPNRGEAYKKMTAYVEEILGSYLSCITPDGQNDFYNAVIDYLQRICGNDKNDMSKKDIMQIRCRLDFEWFKTK